MGEIYNVTSKCRARNYSVEIAIKVARISDVSDEIFSNPPTHPHN